jgi:hypothetical protein
VFALKDQNSGTKSNVLLFSTGDHGGEFGDCGLESSGIGLFGLVTDGEFVPEIRFELVN